MSLQLYNCNHSSLSQGKRCLFRSMVIMLILLTSCGGAAAPNPPPPDSPTTTTASGEIELTINAIVDSTDIAIQCPPICMDVENDSNNVPLSFEVCSPSCQLVETGRTIKIPSDATIKAPDGKSHGQQLTHPEYDVFIGFMSWSDGVTANPRSVPYSTEKVKLTANYGLFTNEDGQDKLMRITSHKAAQDAGCNTTGGWGLFWGASEWVQVANTPEYQEIDGEVTSSHMSGTDFYKTHNTLDYIFNVLLDAEKEKALLSHKSNGQLGERPNQIGVEWEAGSYPSWAWPQTEVSDNDYQARDLVWVKGKWIYDCGHLSDEYSEGTWTELHPPIAVATMRGTTANTELLYTRDEIEAYIPNLNPEAKGIMGTQIDFWANEDPGPVVEHVKCGDALDFFSGTGCVFTPIFNINGVHEFDVPIPPPPTDLLGPNSQFRIAFLRLQPGQPEPEVQQTQTAKGDVLRVKIDLTNYADTWNTCRLQNTDYNENLVNCQGNAYGVTIIAGWEIYTLPYNIKEVKINVNGIRIFNNLEGEGGNGEYDIYLHFGPSSILTGDPLTRATPIALHKINTGIHDAPGELIVYPINKTFVFRIREGTNGSDRMGVQLEGTEEDPFWNDNIGAVERIFYDSKTIWNGTGKQERIPRLWPDQPDAIPDWADCANPTALCHYGFEKCWGTSRGDLLQPIMYEDTAVGGDELYTFSIIYTIESLNGSSICH